MKLRKILSITALLSCLNADTFYLNKGWNLVGISQKSGVIDIHKTFNNSNIKVVWSYKNSKWYGFSPNKNTQTLITQKYEDLKEISGNRGFWIYTNDNIVIDLVNLQTKIGTPLRGGYPFYLKDNSIKWFDGTKFILNANPNEFNNTKNFSYEGFKKAIKFASSKDYFTLWFTKAWFDNGAPENWFKWENIQKALDENKTAIFLFYYFGDNLTSMPTEEEIKDYYDAATTLGDYLSELKGNKIVIIEPEFNKNFIVNSEENSKKIAEIFSNAIDLIKQKDKSIKFSLCMMDTGIRNANATFEKCGYKNCALGDKDEWSRPERVYKYLLSKLDYISFQEMIAQFSRDPSNPGTYEKANLKTYTDSEIGVDYLDKRVENLSEFLYKKYNKKVILAYVAIASVVWNDKNNNGIIEDDEFNKSGWNKKIQTFYTNMAKKQDILYQKGLIVYSPMALIDDPQHDKNGWQFFNKNEYHLGIFSTSAKDEEDKALYGDLTSKLKN